jgi:hypothetical protein
VRNEDTLWFENNVSFSQTIKEEKRQCCQLSIYTSRSKSYVYRNKTLQMKRKTTKLFTIEKKIVIKLYDR